MHSILVKAQIGTAGRPLTSMGLGNIGRVPPLESDCADGTFDLAPVVNAVLQALARSGH